MKVLVVTNMYPSPGRPHWGAFVKSQVDSLIALGIDVALYEIQGWRSPLAYGWALAAIPARARSVRADLVHAHYGYSGAAARGVAAPLVVSFCGDDLLGRPDAHGRLTARSRALIGLSHGAARRADAVIVKSEEMKRSLPSGLSDVHVIPNGVDLARFAAVPREFARTRLGWPQEGRRLLFAGDPDEPRKNWPLAQEVERRLRASGHDVTLIAVHRRPQDDVALAMSAADALLLPSYHEGSPNVVKEAMAAGLPVIAAPVGDCEERLAGCTPGAVVPRDPEAFTAAVARVLASGGRSNGPERVAPLELSIVARQVLAVYERALARRRAA